MSNKNRRRIYFLPRTSQPRLLFVTQGIVSLSGLIASFGLLFFFGRDLTENISKTPITLYDTWKLLLPSLIGINVLVFLLNSITNLLFSHHIAGPAYQLAQVFHALKEGQWWQKVAFRKGDHLKELEVEMNNMIHGTNQRLRPTMREMEVLENIVERLAEDGNAECRQALALVQSARDRLSHFQLDLPEQG